MNEEEARKILLEHYPYSENIKLLYKNEEKYYFQADFPLRKDFLVERKMADFFTKVYKRYTNVRFSHYEGEKEMVLVDILPQKDNEIAVYIKNKSVYITP
jgi:predicted AAA+ superfamily ATPase